MQRTTSGAAGNGLYATFQYMRGAAGIGLGTTIKYLRRTSSAAASNGLSTTTNPPFIVAAFVVNSKPHTRARSSVRLCVGPEFACCVHRITTIGLTFPFGHNFGPMVTYYEV
jgi:hypothetical protein